MARAHPYIYVVQAYVVQTAGALSSVAVSDKRESRMLLPQIA
jgi:hypothetical protein